MGADLPRIRDTWHALHPFLEEEKCVACECLQGALVELRLALEELPPDPAQTELLALVETATCREPHGCLGCEPCHPADILATFYREQQAREVAAACACGEG